MKSTKLTAIRKPTKKEIKQNSNPAVVFEREDRQTGETYIIFGGVCYEGWEQWGAVADILAENCDTIEAWRRGDLIDI